MTQPTPNSTPASSPLAVLFDLDGTLVDTNYQHVAAWWGAFTAAGYDVTGHHIHRAIGLPSEDLVTALLDGPDEDVIKQVTDGHRTRWEALRPQVRAFPRAGELLRACADAGATIVWATSGDPDDIDAVRRLLDCDDVLHAVVGSADIDRGKPHPEVVQVALDKAGTRPDQAVLIGDTVYDMRAAVSAGVRAIGLRCGGIGAEELLEAGASEVLTDPAALLDGLRDRLAKITSR